MRPTDRRPNDAMDAYYAAHAEMSGENSVNVRRLLSGLDRRVEVAEASLVDLARAVDALTRLIEARDSGAKALKAIQDHLNRS